MSPNFWRARAGIDRGRDVGPDADDHAGHLLVGRHGMNQGLFLVRVVHDRAHAAKDRAEEPESQRRIAFGGRDEHRAAGNRPRAVVGVVVARAEQDDVVEFIRPDRDPVDEIGTGGALAVQPFELVVQRVLPGEDVRRSSAEIELVALPRDGKALDHDAVDRLGPGGKIVAPRDVVARAGGQHADVRVAREVLGDVPRVQLGAAVDVGAVPLHHDGELHPLGPTACPEARRDCRARAGECAAGDSS